MDKSFKNWGLVDIEFQDRTEFPHRNQLIRGCRIIPDANSGFVLLTNELVDLMVQHMNKGAFTIKMPDNGPFKYGYHVSDIFMKDVLPSWGPTHIIARSDDPTVVKAPELKTSEVTPPPPATLEWHGHVDGAETWALFQSGKGGCPQPRWIKGVLSLQFDDVFFCFDCDEATSFQGGMPSDRKGKKYSWWICNLNDSFLSQGVLSVLDPSAMEEASRHGMAERPTWAGALLQCNFVPPEKHILTAADLRSGTWTRVTDKAKMEIDAKTGVYKVTLLTPQTQTGKINCSADMLKFIEKLDK